MLSKRSPGQDTVTRYCSRRRLSKFEQVDKWSFCLNAAIIAVSGRDHEQATAPAPTQRQRSPKVKLSRDFRGRSIFDFCNCSNICQHVTSNVDVAQIKSRPKAALNQARMIVDQTAINAGFDFRR